MKSLALALTVMAACNSSSSQSLAPSTPQTTPSASDTTTTAATPPAPTSTIAAPATDAVRSAKPTAQAINAFNGDLYAALKSQPGNLIYSPASIESALAMTSAGARGQTATEMAKVLHLPVDATKAADSFSALLASWAQTDGGGPVLTVANKLWVQQGYPLLPAFSTMTQTQYFAGADLLDFKKAATSAQAINAWVAQSTNGKITTLISPKNIDDSTRLVLTNAIYFKGTWSEPFEKSSTQDGAFTTAGDTKVTVPLMNHTFEARNYADLGNAQIIDLPYKGTSAREIVMTIVLPKIGTPLSALEAGLTSKQVDSWLASEKAVPVQVTLPRFKAEQMISLGQTLIAMGMPTAFSPKADFSGISASKESLSIGAVLHKATIEVDEIGTVAAAATAVFATVGSAAPAPAVPFRADHPFLFFLRDKTSGATLFAGRVTDPSKT